MGNSQSIKAPIEVVKRRAISLDSARGFMLLLIVLAHVPLYLYEAAPGVMSRPESVGFLDGLVNTLGEFFIDNRARPLFAVLFGYGIVMIYESQRSKGKSAIEAMKVIRRRSFALILFGFVLAVFIGGQDILMAYGVASLLVSWVLARSDKVLLTFTVILTTVTMLYLPFLWGTVVRGNGRYGFGSDFTSSNDYVPLLLETLLFFPTIPLFIHFMFPVLPAVLVGMWMARKQLLTAPHQHKKTLNIIAVTGIALSVLGAVPLVLIDEVWQPSLFVAGIIQGIQMITGTVGGIGYAALFGVVGNSIKKPGWITNSLTALGKRSLTFFVLNEALLVILLSPVALGLGGILNNIEVTIVAVLVWTLAVAIAAVLEKFHINGPLETLMRHLVYRKSLK